MAKPQDNRLQLVRPTRLVHPDRLAGVIGGIGGADIGGIVDKFTGGSKGSEIGGFVDQMIAKHKK
jgi:outer membrane lipoprotein SlyB